MGLETQTELEIVPSPEAVAEAVAIAQRLVAERADKNA